MAYNEDLARRITDELSSRSILFEEKKMMGGWAAMVDDKMCMGVIKNDLMARVDPDEEPTLLEEKSCRPMDFTGRPMKGYLYVAESDLPSRSDLAFWVDRCLAFNPRAKSSKKKK